ARICSMVSPEGFSRREKYIEHPSLENPSSSMSFWASSFIPRVAFPLGIDNYEVDVGRGKPRQSTFPLPRRIKFGQAKHCARETVLERTGQSTASFFILASCLPPTTPFRS